LFNWQGRVDGSILCENCIMPICSEQCRNGTNHAVECSVYATLKGKVCDLYEAFAFLIWTILGRIQIRHVFIIARLWMPGFVMYCTYSSAALMSKLFEEYSSAMD
jgi:hypothetical protein